MNLSRSLQKSIQKALLSIYGCDIPVADISLATTEKKFEGSHTWRAFALAGQLKSPPEAVAEAVGSYLVAEREWVVRYQVVKGFLNLTLSPKAWALLIEEMVADLAYTYPSTGKCRVIEFSQPNTNKPLHLGHLRNNFLGTALSNILQAVGDRVYKVNIMNDRGIHICKSMVAYERFGKGRTPSSEGVKGDHFVGDYYVRFEKAFQEEVAKLSEKLGSQEEAKGSVPIISEAQAMLEKWEAGDGQVRTLWERMNGWVLRGFEETYQRTNTTFDKVYYESDTYLLGKEVVKEGLQKGIFYTKEDGSVWIDLEEVGLDKKLLLRGNGTTVYITQDMGSIDERYVDYAFDKHIYVVGSEQKRHFEVLFEIMRKMGRPYADKLYHLSYGMVDLPTGKMKSREGTTVDADHLIDEMVETAAAMTKRLGKLEGLGEEEASRLHEILGIGAIKYFLLRVNPTKRLLFNPKESIDFQGTTASFIQYTHARICTMVEKASWLNGSGGVKGWSAPLWEAEQEVILQLSRYQAALQHAAAHYNPALLADYLYHLAKVYNHLYAKLPIIHAESEELSQRRLYLSWAVAKVIKQGMALLGIEVPKKM